MNYGMIATGNHWDFDSLRVHPLPLCVSNIRGWREGHRPSPTENGETGGLPPDFLSLRGSAATVAIPYVSVGEGFLELWYDCHRQSLGF